MKISVCVDALWGNVDFVQGMQEAKKCGVENVEFWCWWDKDIDAIDRARKELGLQISAFCTKFISLVDRSQHEAYLRGLEETLAVAKKLDCTTIISQVGNDLPDVPRQVQHQNLVDGLKACVPLLEQAGVTLVIEPLNIRCDHAGYYLSSSDEAEQIIDEVGSPYVKILFDLYHQQITEGDIITRSTALLPKIGHMHCAGNPGRHELDIGEINYRAVFDALNKAGYDKYMGFELFPVGTPENAIAPWLGCGKTE